MLDDTGAIYAKQRHETAARMTYFYYLAGAGLLGLGAIYASIPALLVGFYFFANTVIGKALNPYPAYWYAFFVLVHLLYGGALMAYKEPWLLLAGVCFMAGAGLSLATWLGSPIAHRLYGHFDVALCVGIITGTLVHMLKPI